MSSINDRDNKWPKLSPLGIDCCNSSSQNWIHGISPIWCRLCYYAWSMSPFLLQEKCHRFIYKNSRPVLIFVCKKTVTFVKITNFVTVLVYDLCETILRLNNLVLKLIRVSAFLYFYGRTGWTEQLFRIGTIPVCNVLWNVCKAFDRSKHIKIQKPNKLY